MAQYTEKQVKRVVLSFFNYLPKHDSLHQSGIYDAWFTKYGDIIANRETEEEKQQKIIKP